jgi:protoporphyrinogen oxidase
MYSIRGTLCEFRRFLTLICAQNGKEMKRVAVIGAGPAGLAFASRYVEKGGTCVVFEASPFVGGMARSFRLWNGRVDVGPHRFFSSDPVVNSFWHKHVDGNFELISRQTRIYYKNRFFYYPLQATNALRNLGLLKSLTAIISYVTTKIFPPRNDGSLEYWVSSRFGRALFNTFFRVYTEKVWGIRCKEIDADWAAQRIQGLTLWKAVKGALLGNRRNKLKTLVDEFAYPSEGNQYFYDKQVSFINSHGSHVLTNQAIKRVITKNSEVVGIELSDGSVEHYEIVVSSMPITQLIKGLSDVPTHVQEAADQLRFRNTILVYLRIKEADVFPDQWLYIHDPQLLHGRITNFNNWSRGIRPTDDTTILCLEFWCFDEDSIWQMPDAELIELAFKELLETKLVSPELIDVGHVLKLKRSYPVYERGYKQHLDVVTSYLDTIKGLIAIGRYGSFKYNNQDHSILMGILAADAVAEEKLPRLWSINTDSNYQEASESKVLRQP